ncbi:MAG: hypothetical protein JRJ58_13590 [Deltaproteobacteria bacterium]|nr:hypothetical protein [Deltaproteobacteria bacterium]
MRRICPLRESVRCALMAAATAQLLSGLAHCLASRRCARDSSHPWLAA